MLGVRSVFLKAFDQVWHEEVIVIKELLINGKQKVVPNGQVSTWTSVNTRDPQKSLLGQFLFLIYIMDLSDNWPKLFADDIPLFSVIHDINVSTGDLNGDLKKIRDWTFQWKMVFNSDASKQD